MSSEDSSIQVKDLSKRYEIYSQPADRLKQMVLPRMQRAIRRPSRAYFNEFWALRDVSFNVRRGETIGIVGRNGSGKSTLLQMICGTLTPTLGEVTVNGRIAALLELGAGFNPEFTGHENVRLSGLLYGLSEEELRNRYDAILDFAEIGNFIDQPVKTYSSGMYVRLAFAVAINVSPDILVVDEALSVGDEAFQRKCFARIDAIRKAGATILFVSHAASTVSELCNRALLLDHGELLTQGPPKYVVSRYQKLLYSRRTNIRPYARRSERATRTMCDRKWPRRFQPTHWDTASRTWTPTPSASNRSIARRASTQLAQPACARWTAPFPRRRTSRKGWYPAARCVTTHRGPRSSIHTSKRWTDGG